MTTYRKIHGRAIQAVTTDPSESVAEGQVWYNTNSDTFKSVVASEAWSSASPMGRNPANDTLGGCGTPTAGLGFGGYSPPGGTVGLTEEYNGTGWATGGAMNTPEAAMGSFGTQTAAVSAGGSPNSAVTEEYNGTSWTTGNVMGTGRGYSASAGTETSGLIAGGNSPPILGNVEEYNGSTWSEQNNLGTSRYQFTGCGAANTAALVFGGSTPGDTGATEEYDGTNWTAGGSLNTGRRRLAGSGIQTSALAFGGNTTPPDTTRNLNEAYNGSTWAVSPATLATARTALGSTRTSSNNSSAVAFAGINSGGTRFTVTEEFNVSANVITAAAWASGGAAPSGTSGSSMAGNKNDAMMWGGDTGGSPPGWPSSSFSYNGSSWTSEGSIPGVRNVQHNFGAGHTDATGAGGNPGYGDATIEYNGSSWTAGGTKNHDNDYGYLSGGGPQTAGVVLGGGGNSAKHEDYNGTTWTERTDFPSGANFVGTIGSQTALLGVSGANGTTATWNGSAWTVVSDTLNTPRQYGGAGGANSSEAYMFGGGPPTAVTQTELYNGTSWASQPNMANGRNNAGGSGVQSSGLIAGSFYPGNTNVEEFTAETTSLNVKTLTQS